MNKNSFALTHNGHTAWPGKVYPGMGNPVEYYPSCTCGWRGITIDTWISGWDTYGEFHIYQEKRDSDGNLIPSSMFGEQIDALALVLDHLKIDISNTRQDYMLKLDNANSELKIKANELAYENVSEILQEISFIHEQIDALKLYEEASFEPPIALNYRTQDNQLTLAEKWIKNKDKN